MREHRLTTDDLIYPVFVHRRQKPHRNSGLDAGRRALHASTSCCRHAEQCLKLGIPALALFPAIEPNLKTPDGREAFNPKGLVPRAVAALKKRFPELGVITDVALDPYTTHGQDGVIDAAGYVLNDETLAVLREAGARAGRGRASTSSRPPT